MKPKTKLNQENLASIKNLNLPEDLAFLEEKLLKFRTKELKTYQFYKHPYKTFFIDFLEGTFKGIGFFVGGTVIVAILTLLLTKYFASIPVIGEYFAEFGKLLEIEKIQEPINLE